MKPVRHYKAPVQLRYMCAINSNNFSQIAELFIKYQHFFVGNKLVSKNLSKSIFLYGHIPVQYQTIMITTLGSNIWTIYPIMRITLIFLQNPEQPP